MKSNLLAAIRLTLVSLVLLVGIYTSIVLGLAQLVPGKGHGNRILHRGNQYYVNVGQAFTADKYFASRPSAVDYKADGSGGSNKGPLNPEYLAVIQARIDTFLVHNPGVRKSDIPSDLITSSGSGLDPHISVQAARVQVKRIARLRRIGEFTVNQLVKGQIERPLWGAFGPEKVNVLKLNISLDRLDK